MINNHQVEALAAFPQLQSLIDLSNSNWEWLQPARDDNGNIVEIHGNRLWITSGQIDVVRVRSITEATGARITMDGGILWELDGGLVEVVDGLRDLPGPDAANAPRLVKRTLSSLWPQ